MVEKRIRFQQKEASLLGMLHYHENFLKKQNSLFSKISNRCKSERNRRVKNLSVDFDEVKKIEKQFWDKIRQRPNIDYEHARYNLNRYGGYLESWREEYKEYNHIEKIQKRHKPALKRVFKRNRQLIREAKLNNK